MESKQKLLTIEEVAEILKISVRSVYDLIKEDDLPTIQLKNRLTRIPKDKFDQWLEDRIEKENA